MVLSGKYILLFVFSCQSVFPQSETATVKRFGIIGSFDSEFSFHDKVLNQGLGRRWALGLSFTNKKKQFVAFTSIGIKGAKLNFYSPKFQKSFISDLQNNYVPINGKSEDSCIASQMGTKHGEGLWGTYSQFVEAGFILNWKWRPSINFYFGNEEFLLFDNAFRIYEDPKYGDIKYVGMSTTFYSIKLGCTIPFKNLVEVNGSLQLQIGYKWVNYDDLSFGKTPLSKYSNVAFANKYKTGGKLTISLTLFIWSNWES